MKKACFLSGILLLIHISLYAGIDPLFLSEFAQDSDSLHFRVWAGKYMPFSSPGTEDGVIQFENVLETRDDSLFGIIMKLNVPDANIAYLMHDPVQISPLIYTGFAGYSTIISLSHSSRVDYIDMSKPMFQSSDSAALLISVPDMYNNGFFGNGVIAGIIDKGFDSDLDIFRTGGETRFSVIWDQVHDMNEPYPYNYGNEMPGELVLSNPVNDPYGHGTAVLSALASNASVNGGILRSADIAGVNTKLTTKSVIDGIKYLTDYSVAEGKPLALCLPANHFWGRHDGKSMMEQVIDELFSDYSRGRGIAVPAGNLGASNLHFGSYISSADTSSVILGNPFGLIQCIGERTDAELILNNIHSIRFTIIDNGTLYISEWFVPDESGTGLSGAFRYGYDTENGHMHVSYEGGENARIAIEFSSSGGFVDAYVSQGGYAMQNIAEQGIIEGDNINSIAIPGNAAHAVCASAFVSRKYVNDILECPDSIFSFPAWNPVTNTDYLNYIKPDIYAPGKYIITYDNQDRALYRYSENYGAFWGSSFSAAFAAGAMGLLLQAEPGISVARLYEQIRTGVKSVPGGSDGNYYPYGLLDVYGSYLTTAVGTFNANCTFTVIGRDSIILNINSDRLINGLSIYRNGIADGLIRLDEKRVLDIMPVNGNNYYDFYLTDSRGTEKRFTQMFVYSEVYDKKVFFDITGRMLNADPNRAGIFFRIDNNKIEKIIKF